MRSLKAQHSSDELAALSRQVAQQLMAHESWQQSRVVLLYSSLPDEVQTDLLLQAALDAGKRVFLPVVVGDDLELKPYGSHTLMHKGAFNISEPEGAALTDLSVIELAIVPGMAFTPAGTRLGRGRGYYDRLLPQLRRARTIGLCFPFQLVDFIPTEPHDIRLDSVVC